MTPFEVYKTYIALHLHFTSEKYDFFQYHGKVNAKQETFERRNDRAFFHVLAKRKDVVDFIVGSFIELGQPLWIGDMVTDDCERAYKAWSKKQQALTKFFMDDLENLDDKFDDNLTCHPNGYPKLFQMYLGRHVNPETVIILNQLVKFFPHWDSRLKDDFIWKESRMRLLKYQPFFIENVNMTRMKNAVMKRFSDE